MRALTALLLVTFSAVSAFPMEDRGVLRVGESQRYCQSAKQCTVVFTRCDGCDCGVAINQASARAHNDNLAALCADHTPVRCDKVCPTAKPMCVLGLCILQQKRTL
jgi:hypothetical protein